MKMFLLGTLLAMTTTAFAGVPSNRQLDTINANGGASLSVPSVGTALVSDTATQTLTNKTLTAPVLGGTITGTYTLGGTPTIPGSAISSGQVAIANGGTGASSASAARTALSAASSGANSDITSLSGLTTPLSVAQGGIGAGTLTSGSVVIGAGTSTPTFVAPGTNGNVLTNVSGVWTSSAPSASGGSANVVSSVGTPQSISAGTAVAVTGQITNGPNVVFISGNGGAVTVTATPSITACTAAGEQLQLIGGTNNVTLQDTAGLAGSKLKLNGTLTIGTTSPASYSASFVCDAASGNWIELARY